MSSKEQAKKMVESAIEALDRELSGCSDPKLESVPKVQKEVFKKKLQRIYEILNSGLLPEKSQRNLGISHAIADSWPLESKLGEEIAKAERAFIEVDQ